MNKKDILQEEQIYLDKVLGNIDAKIKEVENNKAFAKKQIDDIGIPDKEDKGIYGRYVREYYDSIDKKLKLVDLRRSTHFGRMDLELQENSKVENLIMYIGEKGITSTDQKTLVYDWRSPVANLYYMANQTNYKFNETSYELNLKRQIEIKDSKLIDCYDQYKTGNDINVTDTFLLKVLEQKKNRDEFSDIIRTIQSNQNSIIRDDFTSNAIVQGVAGSGKTVVLLHKISYLLYNNPNIDPKKIIFITPSEIFKTKLASINRSLSLTDILMISMEQYYLLKIKTLLPGIKVTSIIKDDSKQSALLSKVYSDEFKKTIDKEINNYFIEYILKLKKLNISFDISNIYNSLLQISTKIKKTLDNDGWNTFEERDNYQYLLNETRELLKRESVKKIKDRIYQNLKLEFNTKPNWINNKTIYKYNAFILIYIYDKYGFNTVNQFKYMFIDEMQDYANNEIINIINIEKKPYLNLYGDIHQNINNFINAKTIDELITLLKDNLKTERVLYYELNENYRNTRQITDYCNKFINKKMVPMGISSDEVIEINISYKEIVTDIKNNFDNKSIVIITNDDKIIKELLQNEYEVYNVRTAKGLEFSKVIVIDYDLNDIERYVAFTRTLDKLYIYKEKSS
ncbi:MAG: UvrD-helicase domain-containing protein [Ignavibacteriales bacterium]